MARGPVKHPYQQHYLRWRIARIPTLALVAAMTIGIGLASFALRIFESNTDNEILQSGFSATEAVLVASIPGLVVGLALLRIFSTTPFQWRRQVNLCTLADLDDKLYRPPQRNGIHLDANSGVLAVRWYKSSRYLAIVELTFRAWLRIYERSSVDQSSIFRDVPLGILTPDGRIEVERVWARSKIGTPYTAWIPTEAAFTQQLQCIQGITKPTGAQASLIVLLTGKTVGLTAEIIDESEYALEDRCIQIGRPAPVDTDTTTSFNPKDWDWTRYDEVVRQAVFCYGSLLNSEQVLQRLGREPSPDSMPIAVLRDHKRSWSVCTDNLTSTRTRYFTPGVEEPPAIQILFLNAEAAPGESIVGVILHLTADELYRLDLTEGNYIRTAVTGHIENVPAGTDIVWTYKGKSSSVEQARRGIAAGTAVIRSEYRDNWVTAMSTGPSELAAAFHTEEDRMNGLRVEPLDRTTL